MLIVCMLIDRLDWLFADWLFLNWLFVDWLFVYKLFYWLVGCFEGLMVGWMVALLVSWWIDYGLDYWLYRLNWICSYFISICTKLIFEIKVFFVYIFLFWNSYFIFLNIIIHESINLNWIMFSIILSFQFYQFVKL